MTQPTIEPFRIDIPQADLDDLHTRLANTRWPEEAPGGWTYGTPVPWLKELADYWRTAYDWRKHEARLNEFPQFTTNIDGQPIHFLHVRSPEPTALPLVLTHGWPGSVAEFIDMIEPLTNPDDPADAFHVVVPHLPGYGFSGPHREPGWDSRRIAAAWDTLMIRLGYDRYGAHGGDGGSLVGRELGVLNPPGLVGTHVLQIFAFPTGDPAEMARLTEADQKALAILANFQERAGFAAIQGTRPQTLAYGLTDSPAGVLAWNAELFATFGDTPDLVVDRDHYLTNVMLYWLTRTSGSSARMYYEDGHTGRTGTGTNTAPTGVAVFANDFHSIRPFAERDNTNIVHWSEYATGGHFAAMETPDLLTGDLRTFFRPLR